MLERLVFITIYYQRVTSGFPELMMSLVAGIRLDISTISYIIIVVYVLWLIFTFTGWKRISGSNGLVQGIFITIFGLISAANIGLYRVWGTLLNSRAIWYLNTPEEAFASLSLPDIFEFLLLVLVFTGAGYLLFKKLRLKHIPSAPQNKIHIWLLAIVIPIVIFPATRGGVQQIPINESSAHFSSDLVLNHNATNKLWYLGKSLMQSDPTGHNPYRLLGEHEAKQRVSTLMSDTGTEITSLLKDRIKLPNVVIILLESFTADVIGSLGGEPGVAPFTDSLARSGVLFTNIYSSGFRTDQAIVSILNGFPAQPQTTLIKSPSKVEKLKFLPNSLHRNGYNLSFYYGGETGFANLKVWLKLAGFGSAIISKNDFPSELQTTKWGVHDQFVLNKQANELSRKRAPFFSVLLTQSSHEPFDVPYKSIFDGNDEPSRFRNAISYTDHCLKAYFQFVQTQSWYSNTLFILMADHGHRLLKQRLYDDPETRRVPVIIFGDVLNPAIQGTKISRMGNTHDLPATLLNILNIPAQDFNWSKNLLSRNTCDFAYYAHEGGLGWITPESHDFIQYPVNKEFITAADSSVKNGMAYLQELFRQYLQY
jgi:phosphoglycerol transferase MdoB-like AlkP superfamily enzyme